MPEPTVEPVEPAVEPAVELATLADALDPHRPALSGGDLAQPTVEWAVEVAWRDHVAAGAKGPTSQFGPFTDQGALERFLKMQRRDPDIAATRVLERLAAYTPWTEAGPVAATDPQERQLLLDELQAAWRRDFDARHPASPSGSAAAAAE